MLLIEQSSPNFDIFPSNIFNVELALVQFWVERKIASTFQLI